MTSPIFKGLTNILAIGCLILLYLTFMNSSLISMDSLQGFKTIFLSIFLEAIPFILLGVIVAAVLNVFVKEEMIARFIPKNPFLGLIFACFLGVIFPLCECGMIPVVRKLIQKGLPPYFGITYIISGPILNPVVFASTYMAFRSNPQIAYSRMALALVSAFLIGFIVYKCIKASPLKAVHRSSLHSHDHQHNHPQQPGFFSTLGHASDEFFDMGKYLLFGAIITALIQTTVARESLVAIGQSEWTSHLFMAGFAYILSICSTSDAFVAASFTTTFSTGSLLTFLVLGPMLDLKNTLMMLSAFKLRFVIFLMSVISIVVIGISMIFDAIIL